MYFKILSCIENQTGHGQLGKHCNVNFFIVIHFAFMYSIAGGAYNV